MDKSQRIEEIFTLLGLGSEKEREKYRFDSNYNINNKSWELKMKIGSNTLLKNLNAEDKNA
ncbi:hypothetical protein [Paenibacillus pinihumi]|uniref:hypothetical protein n=1 Tax=Paenibacillus pinihumi TaxID=669462 RepID=UPI000418CFFF|nr:hypothetical protein [Paenibacillus pinihumi]